MESEAGRFLSGWLLAPFVLHATLNCSCWNKWPIRRIRILVISLIWMLLNLTKSRLCSINSWDCVHLVKCCCTQLQVWALALEVISTLLYRLLRAFCLHKWDPESKMEPFTECKLELAPLCEMWGAVGEISWLMLKIVFLASIHFWLLSLLWLVWVCVFPAEGKSKTIYRFVLPAMPGLVKFFWAETPVIAATSCEVLPDQIKIKKLYFWSILRDVGVLQWLGVLPTLLFFHVKP